LGLNPKSIMSCPVIIFQISLVLLGVGKIAANVDGFVQPGFQTGCVPP
jgi:hypothetical protein